MKIFDLNDQSSVWSRRFGSDVNFQNDFRRAMECGLAAPLTGDLTRWLSLMSLEKTRKCRSQIKAGGDTRGAMRQALVDANIGN